MQGRNRKLRIDICDYTNTPVCPIYDNQSDVSGQATDVFIDYERNGWKELTFTLPTKCYTSEGEEDNFRLRYIISDYRVRILTDAGEDWFIISEDNVRHEAFSKNVSVTAGHISRLLKNRALDLEFSDEEGNNVGTAKELLTTILESTGWEPGEVADFFEDNGDIKIRSMNASTKTGAFRLIEQMCELFEAKPVYNGDRTVDILPMNPFSKLEPGEIPDAVQPGAETDRRYLVNSNVIELHYDRYVKNLERKTNTENISTRLYGYGAYGDYVTKYCSVQTAEHIEYVYVMSESFPELTEFKIVDNDDVIRYFQAEGINEGDKLIWSMLDFNSRRYVWNENQEIAYKVYTDFVNSEYEELELKAERTDETVTNYFPFLSDYTYYEKIGLLTDEMFQSVAAYQRNMAKYYKDAIEAQAQVNELYQELSTVGIPSSGYLRLDIDSVTSTEDGTKLTIRYSEEYPDGVIYRSDYTKANKNYFKWHVAQNLKANGDPTSGPASIIYVLKHDTDPVQWWCAYLKDIDNRTHIENGKVIHDGYDYADKTVDPPHVITLWTNNVVEEDDEVFLFCVNDLTGKLGARFSEDEAALDKIQDSTTVITQKNPTKFVNYDEPLPEVDFEGFGWCYQYDSRDYNTPGKLYFCWPDRNETSWQNVYIQNTVPVDDANNNEDDIENGSYFYHTIDKTLWHRENGEWFHLESVPDETKLAQMFGIVFMYCRKRDMLYKGLHEYYYYTTQVLMPSNSNWAFPTDFGYYWLFSTDQTISVGETLKLDTVNKYMYQDSDVEHIVTAACYPYDTLIYSPENDLDEATFFQGSIYRDDPDRNGNDMVTDRAWRSNFIPIWPNETYQYSLPNAGESFIVLYDANRNYLSHVSNLISEGEFSTSVEAEYSEYVDPDAYIKYKKAKYIKLVIPSSAVGDPDEIKDNYWIHLKGYETCFFTNDVKYQILEPVVADENPPTGINYLIKRFWELVDTMHTEAIPALEEAQEAITAANKEQSDILGDIWREGYWQDDSYVQGDEARLYNDCLDNLKKIAQPEIEYTFDFLDLYGSSAGDDTEELYNIEWPDIQITDAAHLIDPELQINQWAYIEKLRKCFDQPWKTTIEINTQLTLMTQHDFKDVMARIAEVANETKAKQQIYARAGSISPEGTVSGDIVEGEISTQNVSISGTGWKTDERGNMILESGDGLCAIKFNGSGLFLSNTKNEDGDWIWKELGTGFGINADTITAGYMKGERIEARTITADKLMANVGNELDIGSNKALNLYATLDGLKPSGAIKTTDSIIEVYAGSEDAQEAWQRNKDYMTGNTVRHEDKNWVCLEDHTSGDSFEYSKWREYDGYTPAVIGVRSGGQINLIAGSDSENPKDPPSVNICSGGSINMASEAAINMTAGSEINMASESEINMSANSDINIAAGANINLKAFQNVQAWASNTAYVLDDVRQYDNRCYKCKYNHTSGEEFVLEDNEHVYWESDSSHSSSINLEAGSQINFTSGADINMNAGSQFNINAGAFHVSADSEFTVSSSNFNIDKDGNVSITAEVNTENGAISGWYIGQDHLGNTLDIPDPDDPEGTPVAVTSTVGLRAKGSYGSNNLERVVFWAGSNVPETAPFHLKASGALSANNVDITGGTISIGNSNVGYNTTLTQANGLVAQRVAVSNSFEINSANLTFTDRQQTASTVISNLYSAIGNVADSVSAITGGSTAVQHLSTSGFEISGDSFVMNSTGVMTLMANSNDPAVSLNKDGIVINSGAGLTMSATNLSITNAGVLTATNASVSGTITADANSTLNGWYLDNGSMHRGAGDYCIYFANYLNDSKAWSPRNDPVAPESEKTYYMMWLGADYPEESPDANTATSWAPFAVDNSGNVYAKGYCKRYWDLVDGTYQLIETWI